MDGLEMAARRPEEFPDRRRPVRDGPQQMARQRKPDQIARTRRQLARAIPEHVAAIRQVVPPLAQRAGEFGGCR
ncbi:hypothetical protein [Mangrovicoccus sp. HB161399]|uniref:hypothetical protein n=1 Tax=Mangrovicoccus sp. HB161399 TaxID=2720392 RepID=UPI001552391E|nr:hypothetical protein [Mangrovicoccus sp. HB161399]